MRILLTTFGTRGDIQPFIALGRGLKAAGHDVAVCTSEGFKSFIAEHGLQYAFMDNELLRLSQLALGEIDGAALSESDICRTWDKYSEVASTSAGSELICCEVIVFGNAAGAEGPYFIDHGVMKDAVDGDALRRLIDASPDAELAQVLAKAEADPSGYVRDRRHTMLNDSDLNHTRHARAVVGGVLAYVSGDPMIYVSGGAEHQGPAGGGPVAAIFRRKQP